MPFCRNCGYELNEVLNFCPKCGASLSDLRGSKGKLCPKCGTVMRHGYVVERDSPLSLWTAGQGIYWTPGEGGVIGERVALKAYACPQCGYVEHYVRRLEQDRNTILSAPPANDE